MSAREWNDTITKKLILPVLITWGVLALIFGFLDLQISQAFVEGDSWWGNLGDNYGELPGYGLIVLAIVILIGSFNDDIKKQKNPAYIFLIIGVILLIYGIVDHSETLIKIGGGACLCVSIFMVLTWKKDWNDYVTFAQITLLLAIILPLVFVQLTKAFTQRLRYRELLTLGLSNFTPWFAPPGIGVREFDSNSSFPSGHASMGWMLLPLLLLVKDNDFKSIKRILITTFVLFYGVFVAASRVNEGAHFSSDVLFSSGVAAV
jgi:membrane-associated phospholipid phosphatase